MVHNEQSKWCDAISGVPQRSVLRPLLFATYVDELPEVVQSIMFFCLLMTLNCFVVL